MKPCTIPDVHSTKFTLGELKSVYFKDDQWKSDVSELKSQLRKATKRVMFIF